MSQTRPAMRIPVAILCLCFPTIFSISGAKSRFLERSRTKISRFGARDLGRRHPQFLQEDTNENKVIQISPTFQWGGRIVIVSRSALTGIVVGSWPCMITQKVSFVPFHLQVFSVVAMMTFRMRWWNRQNYRPLLLHVLVQ